MTNPRWALERAVLGSELTAPGRHILLTLAVFADWPSGITPEQHTPSLTKLARSTGLGRSTVAEHLNKLEADGWVRRIRPPVAKARADGDRTCYRLTVPGTSPGAGLVQELDQASPGAGPELVQELDGASPGAGHVPDPPQTNQTKNQHEAPPKSTRGTRVPDDFAVTPSMRAWARENTPGVDLTIEAANFVDHWRAATGAKAIKADWVAAWRTWMRNAQKWRRERESNGRANGHATGANRHVDQLTPEQRAARNPFANAIRGSQATGGPQ